MTKFNIKAAGAALAAAVITGIGIYSGQQRQIQRLRAENQDLLAHQAQTSADQETAAKAAQAAKDELGRLHQDNSELLRLRNEVRQLRRDRDAQKQRTSPPTPSAADARQAGNTGRYISKEQLAFAGYATPEAALESMTWAIMHGTYEQANASLSPELLKHESEDAKGREQFENGRKTMAPLFKGMQIVSRKIVGDDRVEFKVRMDSDPLPNSQMPPPFMIQPMVKVGNEWKLGGSTRGYEANWDESGDIQPLAQ